MPEPAFDAEAFRALGHRVVDLLADHVAATAGRDQPVLHFREPAELLASLPEPGGPGGADLAQLVVRLCADSNRLHHPRYVGHQVCPPPPELCLMEAATALLNNGMAIYEMGPLQTAMEVRALQWLARRLGLAPGADGLLTSGGSLGNLTALLAARQRVAQRPGAAGGPLCLLASDQAHYSIDRAARVLGLGADAVVPVPTDARHRIRAELVPALAARARAAGRTPFALVANAGTTATGAFDPLDRLADVCAALDLWLHVDGAHGAAFALAPSVRDRLRGLDRADSLVIDAHKMLQVPALVTAVLFRRGADATAAFAQDAPYLFAAQDDAWYDRGRRTLECTKRGLGPALYTAVAVLGEPALVANLEHCAGLARALAGRVAAAPDFELAVEPECNIVCFRHTAAGDRDLDGHNRAIRARLLAEGKFYVVQTVLPPRGLFLRCTLINPRTTVADLDALLARIQSLAG